MVLELKFLHVLLKLTDRDLFVCLGGLSSAAFIVAMGYVDCDRTMAIAFLVASWGVGGLVTAGPGVSSLDISPQHAG